MYKLNILPVDPKLSTRPVSWGPSAMLTKQHKSIKYKTRHSKMAVKTIRVYSLWLLSLCLRSDTYIISVGNYSYDKLNAEKQFVMVRIYAFIRIMCVNVM